MSRLIAVLVVAGLAAELGSCTRNGPPAPIEAKGQQRYGHNTAIAASLRGGDGGIAIVQPGDTLYGLARKHGLPTRAIIDANRLEPPYVLQPGQRLTLPRVRTHVVQAGDTISGVSRRYGVDMSSLVRVNRIQPPYTILVGQMLILPGATAGQTIMAARGDEPAAAPPAVPVGRVEAAPLPTPASRPAPANSATVASGPISTPSFAANHAADTVLAPQAGAPAPVRDALQREAPLAPTVLAEQHVAQVEPAAGPAMVPLRAGRGFQWPVRGEVVSDFGPKGGGLHNDGINIAAARGTPIRAAENGVIVYAGNELRGFGNLLLLRHADGWMTAYAHADEISVTRGQRVKRGQIIGRVGSTGNVSSPQIHFEVRRGSRPVNPRDYLIAETASSG